MQYEVPQFIDVKDKVFGPLTLQQFLFLAGGLGGAYVAIRFLFFPLNYIVGIGLGISGGYLGFGQYNGRPFPIMLQAMVGFWTRRKLYLWSFRSETQQRVQINQAPVQQSSVATIDSTSPQTNQSGLPSVTVMPQPTVQVPVEQEKKITKQRLQDIAWALDAQDHK
jgi:hypothetical protein